MKENSDYTINLAFIIDENLAAILNGIDPAAICAIGIDPKNKQLLLTLLKEEVFNTLPKYKVIQIKFQAKSGFGYVRGFIKSPQGMKISAIDAPMFDEYPVLVSNVLDALHKAFDKIEDLYLVCPTRPVNFLLSAENEWKKLRVPINTAICLTDGSLLAGVLGDLKIMTAKDIRLFLKTGQEKWRNLSGNGNIGSVNYLGRKPNAPLVTTSNGEIFVIEVDSKIQTFRIKQHLQNKKIRQLLGPIHENPTILAAITDQSPVSVTVNLFASTQR
jgi:hypothetical protein